jgi:sulfatase modifying factor 1
MNINFFFLLVFGYTLFQSNVNGTQLIRADVEESMVLMLPSDYGLEMVGIPAGKFIMGSPSTEKDRGGDEIEHEVILNEFYISKYEITIGQFKEFIDDSGYKTDAEQNNDPQNWRHDAGGSSHNNNTFNHPVIHVSWNDAMAYVNWLVAKTGKHYQLPTEAQWEYAARGGENAIYAGSNILDEVGWFSKNSGYRTHPVGQKKPNRYGLYDMTGNVWEWCQDWYGPYPLNSVNNPTGASTGTERVIRGGSWFNEFRDSRVAFRDFNVPARRYYFIGFRVVLLP